MYYVLFYKTIDTYLEDRIPYRSAHLELIKTTKASGDLIMAGAFSEPADSAMLIFKTTSTEKIKAFVKNDPYVKQGLIIDWYIRPWAVV